MLSKNDCVHTESIQTLLTSGIVCCTEDDRLRVEEYIACLETKLMNKNCAALKFVAEGLQLRPLRKGDTGIMENVVKIRKIHWVNALVEWVWFMFFGLWSHLIGVPYSARRSRCLHPFR